MNTREPLKITAAAMTGKGEKKPDEYANAFVSHPEPELLSDSRSGEVWLFAHVIKAMDARPPASKRLMEIMSIGCGRFIPKRIRKPAARPVTPPTWCWPAAIVQFQTINDGKDLFRQRGCMGCHRYEGYDKEPEDLNSVGQQIKQIETQKKENVKNSADLMKQADAAESNDEANKLNTQAVDLRVANSKLDARLQQLDFQSHSLMQDQKKVGPNLKDVAAEAEQELDSGVAEEALGFPSDHEDAELPPYRSSDSGDLGLHLAIRLYRRTAQAQARQCRSRKGTVRNARLPGLPLHRRRRPDARRNFRGKPDARWREGELRLSRALDSQRPPADAAVLSLREEGHRSRRLREEETFPTNSTWTTAGARMMDTNCKYRT